MKKVLAAADFSDATSSTLTAASELVRLTGGSLCLLTVASPEAEFVGRQMGRKVVEAPPPAELAEDFVALTSATEALVADGIDATCLMVRGDAVECILEESRRLGAELIVLGSHGHGRLYRSFVGSVSEGVLRDAHCPVLVVPVAARR